MPQAVPRQRLETPRLKGWQDSPIERSGFILQMGPKLNIADVFQAAP